MKICRFDEQQVGIVSGSTVYDISDLVRPLLEVGPAPGDPLVRALPRISERLTGSLDGLPHHPLEEVRLLSPVSRPTKIVAVPVNYRAHVVEANDDPGIRYGHTQTDIGAAGLFLKANSSLVGPGDGIPIRFPDRRTDYEAELVVVIGGEGSDIAEDAALDVVAGYAVGLDITLRGPEDRSFRKSLDGYSVVGPWLTTADEVGDPDALALTLDQNGIRRQSANSRDMVYGVRRLIAFASSFYTLFPGDLLFTGTPEGVGPIQPSDRLVASIEKVGRLETTTRAHRTPEQR